MSNQTENRCYRCRTDCTPVANLAADVPGLNGMPASFVCVGWNRPTSRIVPADRFTLCWKNDEVDEWGHWDKRDLLDTLSVIAQALSTDENVRVNERFDEQDMQQVDMVYEA
jgi:hypothetical protein